MSLRFFITWSLSGLTITWPLLSARKAWPMPPKSTELMISTRVSRVTSPPTTPISSPLPLLFTGVAMVTIRPPTAPWYGAVSTVCPALAAAPYHGR
ncbi:hypothetical protein D3C78_1544300 [compost metagenome]